MKIKVALGNDMRSFRIEGESALDAHNAVTTFVTNTFEIDNFRLQYRDDEDDLITVTSPSDLEEAIDVAKEQGKTLKLFVVAVAAQQAAQQQEAREEKNSEPPPAVEAAPVTVEPDAAANTDTNSGEEEKKGVHDLMALLVADETFRQEFAAFAQDVVLQIREEDDFETAVQVALATHEEVASHPFIRNQLRGMLPMISQHAAFAVPFLKTLDPNAIPGMIEQAIQMFGNFGSSGGGSGGPNPQAMMPFLASMLAANAGNNGPGGGPPPGFPFGPPHGMNNPNHHPMGGMPFFGGFPPHGHHFGPPAPTSAQPAAATTSAPDPEYQAEIVADNVTLVDNALVLPNSSVVKTWQIRNTGNVPFPEATKLKYVGEPFNQLVDGVEFPVEPIGPGDEGVVSVFIQTPGMQGEFESAWRLHLPNGTAFGPTMHARVQVVGGTSWPVDDDMADIYGGGNEAVSSPPIVSTLATETPSGDGVAAESGAEVPPVEEDDGAFENELAELQSMGFSDMRLNRMLLRQFDGQMDAVLNTLCELKA